MSEIIESGSLLDRFVREYKEYQKTDEWKNAKCGVSNRYLFDIENELEKLQAENQELKKQNELMKELIQDLYPLCLLKKYDNAINGRDFAEMVELQNRCKQLINKEKE